MANRNIPVTHEGREMAGREEMRKNTIRPAVDIFETDEGLTLLADMPGVRKEDLSIDIDKGILTLKGEGMEPAAGEAIYTEFSLGSYFRQFQLPDEIDAEKVKAELKEGVLTLNMPKAEAAKPRRIEITH